MTRRTLTERRRTAGSPEIAALEKIGAWLEDNRRLHRLEPRGAVHVHLTRQSPDHPWAEVATYRTTLEFGLANAIVDRRSLL